LVEKLKLPIIPHSKPYKPQWLIEDREIQMTKQFVPSFSIGKIHGKVLYDVVSMETNHLLLGRP